MANRDDVFEAVLLVLEQDLEWPVDRNTASMDTPLGAGGLGLASVNVFETVISVESAFGVTLSEDDVAELADATIGGLVDLVVAQWNAVSRQV